MSMPKGVYERTAKARASNSAAKTKHGMWQTPTWRSWRSMLSRCFNPAYTNYRYWGGRGITVCERWRNSFENFLADMGVRPEGATLDRLDNEGHYEPGNCQWATAKQQAGNRRQRQVCSGN